MTDVHSDVVDALQRLIETCWDGERGFREAAEAVRDPAIKRLFAAYAQQREEFAKELEAEARRLGTPVGERRGSVAGTLHRALINLRAAIAGRDEAAVLAEAERGEDTAGASYEETLRIAALPSDLRAVIARQAARVKEARESLGDLKRAA